MNPQNLINILRQKITDLTPGNAPLDTLLNGQPGQFGGALKESIKTNKTLQALGTPGASGTAAGIHALTPLITGSIKEDPAMFNVGVDAMTSQPLKGGSLPIGGLDQATAQYPAGFNAEAASNAIHGWASPQLKVQFDQAILNNDANTIKSLLPSVPSEYKARIADRIASALSGKMVSGGTDLTGFAKSLGRMITPADLK